MVYYGLETHTETGGLSFNNMKNSLQSTWTDRVMHGLHMHTHPMVWQLWVPSWAHSTSYHPTWLGMFFLLYMHCSRLLVVSHVLFLTSIHCVNKFICGG